MSSFDKLNRDSFEQFDESIYKSIQEIKSCGYEPIQKLGDGSYGVIWGVIDRNQGRVAYKYIVSYDYEKYGLDSLNEIDVSTRVNHPYIAHTYKVVTALDCKINGVALLLPEGDRGSLMDLIEKKAPLSFLDKLRLLYQLATAVEFLHRNNILHLDIKLMNVVLRGPDLHPYLIDFGLAMVVNDVKIGFHNPSTFVTVNYRAPEILSGSRRYNAAVDVWAFGILMLYMFAGFEIYTTPKIAEDNFRVHTDLLREMAKFQDPKSFGTLLRKIPADYMEITQSFFSRVLSINPDNRLTMSEIVNHPLFDNVRFNVTGSLIQPSLNNSILTNYSLDHQNMIDILVSLAFKLYPIRSAELLFLAIDLYARTASMYVQPELYDRRLSLVATCLWMAAKLLRLPLRSTTGLVQNVNRAIPMIKPLTNIMPEDILRAEISVVHYTGGRLDISELYRSCQNARDLAISLKYVIGYNRPDHDPITYSIVDIPAWIQYIQNNKWSITSTSSKDININDLVSITNDIRLV